jgi:UDP-N-acetylmuramoylalanine--D-glutamate ligase
MILKDKNILLVGLGRSSVAAARLVLKHGGHPFISEMNDHDRLNIWREQCAASGIPFETGGHNTPLFDSADLVVINPGVPYAASCLDGPKEKNIPVIGELELAAHFSRSKCIAVTGTNGKTTATSLLKEIISADDHTVALAGNTHTAWSEVVLEEEQPEFTVLEVSSYQLETVRQFHPEVAVVLNISPDHLGRHGTMSDYAAAKARIFAQMTHGNTVILNGACPYSASWSIPEGVQRVSFGIRSADSAWDWSYDERFFYFHNEVMATTDDLLLPGRHNRENVVAMLATACSLGLHWEKVLHALRTFSGVEHRIEFVRSLEGVTYFNDSKSTNLDSLRVALESFESPVVLIAGGQGKGSNYEELLPLMTKQVAHLIAIGDEAPLLEKSFAGTIPLSRADSMQEAVHQAHGVAKKPGTVLLSPACASFDWYANYEERGQDFKHWVQELAEACGEQEE